MTLCTVLNLVLIATIVMIMFGIGMLGGIPRWYRDIREGNSTCDDMKYANDAKQWDVAKIRPKKKLDRYIWDLAQTVQGDDPAFIINLNAKIAECLVAKGLVGEACSTDPLDLKECKSPLKCSDSICKTNETPGAVGAECATNICESTLMCDISVDPAVCANPP